MDYVYTDYFQKSRVFLYPLLDIPKGVAFKPIQTYISWENKYTLEDKVLICVYKTKNSVAFKNFEVRYIKNNRLFKTSHYIKNNTIKVYVFDMKSYKYDFDVLIKGRYTKLSLNTKIKILKFFDRDVVAKKRIQVYLNPSEEDRNLYAEVLNVKPKIIQELYELCSIINIDKETLKEKEYNN